MTLAPYSYIYNPYVILFTNTLDVGKYSVLLQNFILFLLKKMQYYFPGPPTFTILF